jgi:hypothetical protein
MAVGVFDLSSVGGPSNHMVGINGVPDKDGLFDPSDIVPTSSNDKLRLGDERSKGYTLNNIKEIRVINVDTL